MQKSPTTSDEVYRVVDLKRKFAVKENVFKSRDLWAVNGVSFSVKRRQTLGLVGESGCGKSTVGKCLMKLLMPTAGSLQFKGEDITGLTPTGFWPYRRQVQMVFQDPTDSLNPRMTVWDAVSEPLTIYTDCGWQEKRERVLSILNVVGLKEEHLDRFPHQLSIGQQQRVGIARAVILSPDFLVLDEPTSALDVSVRGMVLKLLNRLQEDMDLSYLFISHDLSVIKHICNDVAVMYLGMMVEYGPVEAIFTEPLHPYTQALIAAVPIPDPAKKRERVMLSGEVPSPLNLPPGCLFYSRCRVRMDVCKEQRPGLEELAPGRTLACWRRG